MDFSKITLDDLSTEHPQRVMWQGAWADYDLLYRGGMEMKRAAGMSVLTVSAAGASVPFNDLMAGRRRRFLRQLEGEPDISYIARWEYCFYTNYVGVIIDYFRHWLFSQTPQIRPKIEADTPEELADAEAPEPPDWFDAFMRDATGSGTSFFDLGKQVFGDVLVLQRSGWLIGLPDAVGESGDSDDDEDAPPVSLTVYKASEIYDWQEDSSGCLEWILLQKKTDRREFPEKRRQVEVRTYVDRDSWAAWEIIQDPDTKETTPTLIAEGKHGLGEVPFEWMVVPQGLWVMNKLASWAIDLFNQESMLTTSQLQSCFLQPYIKSAEASESATNRIMGSSVVLQLRAGTKEINGEEFGWAVPDITPLKFSAERLLQQRDEGYRIVHQMSLAVDSQAIGAIARSGASKIEDRKATEIMLCAYGGYVRDFFLRTLNKISRMLGDDTEWVIDGYDNFEVSSVLEEIQLASLLQTLNIESPTYNAELQKSVALGRTMAKLDETLKAKIRREIDERVEMKAELISMGPTQVNPVTGEPMPPELTQPAPGSPAAPPKSTTAKPKGPAVKDT